MNYKRHNNIIVSFLILLLSNPMLPSVYGEASLDISYLNKLFLVKESRSIALTLGREAVKLDAFREEAHDLLLNNEYEDASYLLSILGDSNSFRTLDSLLVLVSEDKSNSLAEDDLIMAMEELLRPTYARAVWDELILYPESNFLDRVAAWRRKNPELRYSEYYEKILQTSLIELSSSDIDDPSAKFYTIAAHVSFRKLSVSSDSKYVIDSVLLLYTEFPDEFKGVIGGSYLLSFLHTHLGPIPLSFDESTGHEAFMRSLESWWRSVSGSSLDKIIAGNIGIDSIDELSAVPLKDYIFQDHVTSYAIWKLLYIDSRSRGGEECGIMLSPYTMAIGGYSDYLKALDIYLRSIVYSSISKKAVEDYFDSR